jgi:hypothetical protein
MRMPASDSKLPEPSWALVMEFARVSEQASASGVNQQPPVVVQLQLRLLNCNILSQHTAQSQLRLTTACPQLMPPEVSGIWLAIPWRCMQSTVVM